MAANEIAFVDPQIMMVDGDKITIPVGTLAVVPHVPFSEREDDFDRQMEAERVGEEFIPRVAPLPEFTILCIGQSLTRSDYTELSPHYADTGGFYDFVLPNLVKRYIIGVNSETDEILWGDGVIYFQSVPVPVSHAQPQIVNR